MYSWAVFAGGRPLRTQILPGQGRPRQPFLSSETRDTGLPDGEDHISLRYLVLTQYRSVSGGRADKWTDRRTNGFAVAPTAIVVVVVVVIVVVVVVVI